MRIPYNDVKILITLVGLNRTIPSEIMNLFEKIQHSIFSFQRGKNKHLYFDGVHLKVNVEVSFTFFQVKSYGVLFAEMMRLYPDSIQVRNFCTILSLKLKHVWFELNHFSQLKWLHYFLKVLQKKLKASHQWTTMNEWDYRESIQVEKINPFELK